MAVKADQATEMNVSWNESWNSVHKEKRPEGLRYVFQGITVLSDSSVLVSFGASHLLEGWNVFCNANDCKFAGLVWYTLHSFCVCVPWTHPNVLQNATLFFVCITDLKRQEKEKLRLHPELLTGRTVYSGSGCYGDSWSFRSPSPNRQRGVRRRNRVISGSGTSGYYRPLLPVAPEDRSVCTPTWTAASSMPY